MDNLSDSLPAADQACKECTRRKAKCDRLVPECSTCARFRRHCLYDKHSRTPLTRKHLTQVEARLHQVEALLKKYQDGTLVANPGKSSPSSPGNESTQKDHSEANDIPKAWGGKLTPPSSLNSWSGNIKVINQDALSKHANAAPERPTPSPDCQLPVGLLEGPPATLDGFDWDELSKPMTFGDAHTWRQRISDAYHALNVNGDTDPLDGMASLSIDGNEVGYVGTASVASFLKFLWDPTKDKRFPSPHARNSTGPRSSMSPSAFLPETEVNLPLEVDCRKVIADSFIDAYFSLFHYSIPIIHESTFRAVYTEIIPRPHGSAWIALANIVAAIGAFTAMTECLTVDTPFFYSAKAALSVNCLEAGNTTLVQALGLMSYYLQKRNKPNTSYNYAGLAVRMAIGLGLHREFPGWDIPLLKLEMRRRLWWGLFVMDSGQSMCLSRPNMLPRQSIEVPLPLSVNDRDLTPATVNTPKEPTTVTMYTPLRAQASFHIMAMSIYERLISHPYPSPKELLELDEQNIPKWYNSLPSFFQDDVASILDERYALVHMIVMCRHRVFRITMYRPYIIHHVLHSKQNYDTAISAAQSQVHELCIKSAREVITLILNFWKTHIHTRMAAWYALYYTFQAALIPIICLRTWPSSREASQWRFDIRKSLDVIEDINFLHGFKCAETIHALADPYLDETKFLNPVTPPIDMEVKDVNSPRLGLGSFDPLQFTFDISTNNFEQPQTEYGWPVMWPGVPMPDYEVDMDDPMSTIYYGGFDPDYITPA